MALFMIIYFAVIILTIASFWVLFDKAGKPGWASIVPIYNIIIMLEIIRKPVWWILLIIFVPFFGIYVHVLFIKAYGKSTGFALLSLLLFFILIPMMAFSSDTQYVGADANGPSNILDASVK